MEHKLRSIETTLPLLQTTSHKKLFQLYNLNLNESTSPISIKLADGLTGNSKWMMNDEQITL